MLIVAQLAKTFYLFSGTQIFITMRDFRFPQRSYWGFWSSGMLRYVANNATYTAVSEERSAFVFKGSYVPEKAFTYPVPVESIPTFPSYKLFHPLIFLTSACISHFPCLLHPPTLCHPNNIQWTVQIIKFFIMYFSPVSSPLLPLRSKHYLQHTVLKNYESENKLQIRNVMHCNDLCNRYDVNNNNNNINVANTRRTVKTIQYTARNINCCTNQVGSYDVSWTQPKSKRLENLSTRPDSTDFRRNRSRSSVTVRPSRRQTAVTKPTVAGKLYCATYNQMNSVGKIIKFDYSRCYMFRLHCQADFTRCKLASNTQRQLR